MLSGHLCRCTGYQPIVDAIDAEAAEHAVNLAHPCSPPASATPEPRPSPRRSRTRSCARARARSPAASASNAGDRVAVVLDNRLETALLYWAAQWSGAVFVPLSWRLAGRGARLLHRGLRRDGRAPRRRTSCPDGPGAPGRARPRRRETPLMLYTSGTTGRPKGVPRSHRADRAGGLSQALQHGYGFGDRTLGVMPLYHTMGIHSLLAMHLLGGCFVRSRAGTPHEALRLIEEERITSLYLAPTLFHDLVHHPGSPTRPLVRARARLRRRGDDRALVERCAEVFQPAHLLQPLRLDGDLHVLDRPRPGGQARLRRAAGGERPPPARPRTARSSVHLVARDEAFTGYWNRPDADAKAIRDGWYHTGDVGRLDEDGDLWIVGRVDDMIISGGENIHPLEVEDVLASHPACARSRSSARRTTGSGQRVVAVRRRRARRRRSSTPSASARTLARFKRPREYRFVEALPKSPSGKILRRILRRGGDRRDRRTTASGSSATTPRGVATITLDVPAS